MKFKTWENHSINKLSNNVEEQMDSVEGEVAPTKEDTNAGTKEDTKKWSP